MTDPILKFGTKEQNRVLLTPLTHGEKFFINYGTYGYVVLIFSSADFTERY